jgi:hypothetical protein
MHFVASVEAKVGWLAWGIKVPHPLPVRTALEKAAETPQGDGALVAARNSTMAHLR